MAGFDPSAVAPSAQRLSASQPITAGPRQLAGFGERDERNGTESKLAASSADDKPLNPASGTGRLDEQIHPAWNRELFRKR